MIFAFLVSDLDSVLNSQLSPNERHLLVQFGFPADQMRIQYLSDLKVGRTSLVFPALRNIKSFYANQELPSIADVDASKNSLPPESVKNIMKQLIKSYISINLECQV